MNCGLARTRLSALLDGEVEPAEADALRTHVRACGRCGPVHAAYQQDLALLREFVTATAPWKPAATGELERLGSRGSAVRRTLGIGGRGLASAAQLFVVLAVLAGLALLLRALTSGTQQPPVGDQAQREPARVVEAFLAARADQDVARVRALVDDQAVVDLDGQTVEVRMLHFDSEIRHWLIQDHRQFTAGPLRVAGDRVSWREHVVQDTPRLPGVPALELDQDATAIVRGGKITALTFALSPAAAR